MKKYLSLLLMPIALFWACNPKETTPEPTPVVGEITLQSSDPVVLSDEGDSKQVAFGATLAWTAASADTWLTVEPRSGEAGEALTVTVRAAANGAYDPRTTTLTLTCGEDSKTVQVTQKQKGALILTDSTIPVEADGKVVTITAKANANVSAAIDDAAKDWITVITPKALVDYVFEFSVAANTEESPRSGQIVFSNEYGSETVTIEQEGYVPPIPSNVTGRVTCNGAGVPNVLVSDGIQIVKTDAEGNYGMHSEKKWQNVFVIIPSGYEAPLDGVQPQFYKVLTEDVDTPEQADFELVESSFTDFRLLVLGDMHLANRGTPSDMEQFDKVAQFIGEQMDMAPGKVFALTLGDHAWDMYWVSNHYNLTDYLSTINSYFGSKGVPFFFTMGNHDNEMEKAGDVDKALAYIHTIAPTYYSFNLADVHFIVLDDMDFTGVEEGKDNRSKYKKNFTADQLEWLRADLSHVDKSKLIVLSAHEPMAVPDGLGWKEELNGADADKTAFLSIFDGYNVEMMTGHTHSIFNRELSPTFHEHNYGAVCGTWWWSGHLTPGIHIGQEGSPGGFGVFDFGGNAVTNQYYQAACKGRDYQFRAYDMNEVKKVLTEDYADGHSDWTKYYNYIQGFEDNVIFLNVWDWDENWNVEVYEGDTKLEVTPKGGVYDPLHIAAFTGPRLRRSDAQGTSPSFQTRKWNHYFQATASSATSTVTVKVTDRYGNVFQEVMVRPKAFSIDEYENDAQRTGLVAESISSSSSTLAFKWTQGDSDADDMSAPYKAALYRDQALTDLALSFDIPAKADCWTSGTRFVFGGLTPSTTYWFQVQDTKTGEKSAPVSAATKDFTVVDPSKVSNAGVGDVILAEDFSELTWNADMLASAGGFIPNGKSLEPLSGNYTTDDGSFKEYNNTAGRIYGETRVPDDKRLFNWGFFGNSSVYAYAGYFRVGSSSSGARTHIVSPALSGIPEGKLATIDVTVTYAKYDSSGSDVAVFLEDHSSLNLVLAPDQKENSNFSKYGGKYEGATLQKGYPMDSKTKEWSTNTVRIEGVSSNNCLLFGSSENIDTKNRFFLSDVKVQIVSLEDIPAVSASLGRQSSCSLSFTWTEGGSAADDIAKPWTIALYKDAACTDLVVSHNISGGNSCWDGKKPRFVFGGLDAGTDYWFKATDTTEGDVKVSNVVKASTLPFTRIDATTVSNAAVGDIILAEDFSEVHYGPDEFDVAAGFMPSPRTLEPITGEDPDGSFEKYSSTSTRLWGNGFTITEGTRLSHGWGFYGNSAVYSRVGYFRCATTAENARTHIVTPKLKGIPDGMVATIEVTVTDRMYETNGDVAVFKASNLVMDSTTDLKDAKFGKYTGSGALSTGYPLGISTGSWQTKSVTITGVTNQDQLLIGSYENINVKGSDGKTKSKNRHNLSEVVVKIVELSDANRTTAVSVIGDSISTFKGWCDTTKGGAYYPKNDCDVASVTDTWWYKLIYDKMTTGKFEKNISAGNTTVVQNTTGDSSAYWYGWDFGTRLQQLGIGNPDVVLIHGGTNDYGHTSWYKTSEELIDGVAMDAGSFPEASRDKLEELFALASDAATVADADALDGTTFCSAYIRLIRMIQVRHPEAKVVCVIGDYLRGGQGDAIKRIAQLFGDDKVRYADIQGEGVSISKYSSPHPDAAGMATMADFIYSRVGEWIDVAAE